MSTATLAALAADPLLPQRDLLLDEQVIAQRLAAHLGVCGPLTLTHCERPWAKYRMGESLRMLHVLQVDGEQVFVSSRTFTGARSRAVYRQAMAVAVPCGPLHAVIHDADLDTVFWTFPNDRKLTTLQVLTTFHEDYTAILGRPWRHSRLVGYAPERAAVVQCLDDQGDVLAYAKVFTGEGGGRSAPIHHTLAQRLPDHDPHVRLPRHLAYVAPHRLLLLEAMAGQRLTELTGHDLHTGLRCLGAALARFHTLPPPPAVPQLQRPGAAHLHQAAQLLGRARPDVARLADNLASRLVDRWQEPTADLVCLHGDVKPQNSILHHGRVTLLDLDQVAMGPASVDLGGLLSVLRAYCWSGVFPPGRERALASAILEGYAAVRPLPEPSTLCWYTAAALLVERALRAVSQLRMPALLHLETMLADAMALLEGERHV